MRAGRAGDGELGTNISQQIDSRGTQGDGTEERIKQEERWRWFASDERAHTVAPMTRNNR